MSFEYISSLGVKFQKNLECAKCIGTTRAGEPCKRRTCQYLPTCFQHSKSIFGVIVKESTIPNAGKGLFAAKEFEPNDLIVDYGGEVLTKREIDKRYGSNENDVAPYVYDATKNKFVDSCCKRSLGAYA